MRLTTSIPRWEGSEVSRLSSKADWPRLSNFATTRYPKRCWVTTGSFVHRCQSRAVARDRRALIQYWVSARRRSHATQTQSRPQAPSRALPFNDGSRLHDSAHLGTRQYARILGHWVDELGLDRAEYGTHSMRRTKATLIYRRTKNLRAVQLLLGHSKLESTVRYLGIEVDDALEISEQTEI